MRHKIASHTPEWYQKRATHLGASETACLFGCGYQSFYDLWMTKAGRLAAEDFSQNERIIIGAEVEDGIARAAARLHKLQLIKADEYVTDDTVAGLGCTPDYYLVESGGVIPVEVKNSSWGTFRDAWYQTDEGIEPPERFSLQLQTQIACLDAQEGLLIALIAGERIELVRMARHERAIAEIRKRVTAFWDSIRKGIEPEPALPGDIDTFKRTHVFDGEQQVDLSGDPDIEGWLMQLRALRDAVKRFEDDKTLIEGKVLKFCLDNDYAAVRAEHGRISVKQRPAKDAHTVQYKAQPARIEMRINPR